MSEKILIFSKGFLGSSIHSVAKDSGLKSICTQYSIKKGIDITNLDSLEKTIYTNNPDLIINCAALTQIDKIELDSARAYEVNAIGAKNIAIIADRKKIKFTHISTDSVFDGKKGLYTEEDQPNPINEYAKSKNKGEELVKQVSENYKIVRTNFYGYNKQGKHLFNWILTNLRNNVTINAFDDVIFNPLEIKNLALMIIELGFTDFYGIIHLASDEIMSKYEFATRIAKILGYDNSLIKKGSIKDSKLIAKRPLNTTLANDLSKKILKTKPILLQDWLISK